jgi:hypothetical protein
MCSDLEFRVQSGCDEPSEFIIFEMTCPDCSGADPGCERCEGSGNAAWRRCPRQSTSREALDLVQAYRAMDRGFLPAPGAWMDQAACFVRWVGVIDAERNGIEEERAKRVKSAAGTG